MSSVYRLTVPAQNRDPTEADSSAGRDKAFAWINATSPVTPQRQPNGKQPIRVIRWADYPGGLWLYQAFLIAAAADWPKLESGMGSIVNLHNSPGDIGWSTGQPVSAYHLWVGQWEENSPDPALKDPLQVGVHLENAAVKEILLPRVQPGKVYRVWSRIVGGRVSGTPLRGSVRVWASADDGATWQAFSREPVDFLQPGQVRSEGWDGGPYILGSSRANAGNKVWRHQQQLTRYGTTVDEAAKDAPVFVESWGSVYLPPFSPNLGSAKVEALPSVEWPLKLPTGLAGGVPVLPPPPVVPPVVVPAIPVTIEGPTSTLAGGDVIVVAPDGTGHRLYPTVKVTAAMIVAVSGHRVRATGTPARTDIPNFPLNVDVLVDLAPLPTPAPVADVALALKELKEVIAWMGRSTASGGLGYTQGRIERTHAWKAYAALGGG